MAAVTNLRKGQGIRTIQADAREQQARLWLAGPTPKEPNRLRRWLRSA